MPGAAQNCFRLFGFREFSANSFIPDDRPEGSPFPKSLPLNWPAGQQNRFTMASRLLLPPPYSPFVRVCPPLPWLASMALQRFAERLTESIPRSLLRLQTPSK